MVMCPTVWKSDFHSIESPMLFLPCCWCRSFKKCGNCWKVPLHFQPFYIIACNLKHSLNKRSITLPCRVCSRSGLPLEATISAPCFVYHNLGDNSWQWLRGLSSETPECYCSECSSRKRRCARSSESPWSLRVECGKFLRGELPDRAEDKTGDHASWRNTLNFTPIWLMNIILVGRKLIILVCITWPIPSHTCNKESKFKDSMTNGTLRFTGNIRQHLHIYSLWEMRN